MNIIRCDMCKFWKKNVRFEWMNSGICDQLRKSDKVMIEIKTGWDGGYVDYLETDSDFGCVLYEEK